MALTQLIYCSAASDPDIPESELIELMHRSRENNAKNGVTGILLFHRGSFFQIVEGERDVVERLYDVISDDPRHCRITKILVEDVGSRDFPDWTMGFPHTNITEAEIENIPGMNHFFEDDRTYLDMCHYKSRLLLNAFRDGQWHVSRAQKVILV